MINIFSKKMVPVCSLVAAIILFLAGYYGLFKQTDQKAEQIIPPKNVQVVAAVNKDISMTYDGVARLKAKQVVSIRYPLERRGQVEKLLFKDGAKVNQGQPLLEMLPALTIKAPFSGRLAKWQVQKGENVQPGTELVKLTNNSTLLLEYWVPEEYQSNLTLGQKVIVKVKGLATENFVAKVSYIAPEVSEEHQSVQVQAELVNSDNKLLPGMFVKLQHILKENTAVLSIPESCIKQTIAAYQTFKVEDGKAKKVDITLGSRKNGWVQITSGEITIGDEIILAHYPGLVDGAAVKSETYAGEEW